VGAIETKTNDYFRSRTEVAYPRIWMVENRTGR